MGGEVWALSPARVEELDAFERCPDLYVREDIAVIADGGAAGELEVFVYVLAGPPPADAHVIPPDGGAARSLGAARRRR